MRIAVLTSEDRGGDTWPMRGSRGGHAVLTSGHVMATGSRGLPDERPTRSRRMAVAVVWGGNRQAACGLAMGYQRRWAGHAIGTMG